MSPRPFPPPLRNVLRFALRRRAKSGRKCFQLVKTVEEIGGRLASRPLQTRLPNGCVMTCNLAQHVQRHIYFRGLFEPVEAFLVMRLLKAGMTVIDAGAYVGQYTLLAATAVGSTGAVYSFEPIPETFARLRDHVECNRLSNVVLERAALWSENTIVHFGLPGCPNDASWAVLGQPDDGRAPTAPAVRLDDYAARRGLRRVDFIKFDVEGAEVQALAGARQLIGDCRPTMLVEVYPPAMARLGNTPRMLWEALSEFGYRTWEIGDSPETSGLRPNFEGVELANFLVHVDDLPPEVTGGWSRREPRRWACSGW